MALYPLARERKIILVSLLVLALAAWAVVIYQSSQVDDDGGMDSAMSDSASHGTSVASADSSMTDSTPGAPNPQAEDSASGEMSMGLTMDMGAFLFIGVWI